MRSVSAYATPGPHKAFEKTTIERRDLGPEDVLIKIHYAGICHSDIHTGRSEWGETIYPLVPGHEIAGTVEEIGSGVTKYAVGDRVGVGCFVDSCRKCEYCLAGLEQFCVEGSIQTYNAIGKDGEPTRGGYSTHIVVDENYVVRIPDGISLDVAAPLLCAGITLYSPLKHWNAGPGKRVGIVGLGGLGHVGVKIAAALGAKVTVLSRSADKEADAKSLGAHDFLLTSDRAAFKAHRGHFDLIINTVSAPLDMGAYLSLLRVDGAVVNVGAPPADTTIAIHPFALIGGRKTWAGSMIGGIRETQEMLDFCAEHGIGAEIELISGEQIDQAWERVVDSDVRYRFVIDTATF
jgi:alcohol dehydrogenase (NADP+)